LLRTTTGAAGSSCWDAQSAATVPLVYDARYNITLWGIEKLHPFDSCKFAKIVAGLEERGAIAGAQQLVAPAGPIGLEWLQQVHSADYLHALHTSSLKVAQVCVRRRRD
jgi:histone deacetylase 11